MNLVRPMSEDYAEFLRDESRSVGKADSISFPRDEDEIRAIVRDRYACGCRITVQGARTGLTAAAVPDGGHILNLTRCNRTAGLRINNEGRFCLRAGPGLALTQLRKQIEDRRFNTNGWSEESLHAYAAFQKAPRQFFPTDPTESTASLGGMAACNASGARSFLYGPMRRHITGLRIVLGDGQTLALRRGELAARGRVLDLETEQRRRITLRLPSYQLPDTKSAAGYHAADNMDAIDLFIGSDGTLGVISELELELLPLPPVVWGVTFFFRQETAALDFVIAVRNLLSGSIAALEYFDEQVLTILRRQKLENPAFAQLPFPEERFLCAVFAELQGPDEDQAIQLLFRLGSLMRLAGGCERDTWVARTAFDQDKLIFFRHAAPECVNMIIDQRRKSCPAITKLGTDMSVPDRCLRDVLVMYRQGLQACGLEYAIWGHIGNNHLHVNILPRQEEDYRRGKALYREWAARVVQMGGSVAAEHGIGKLKADFLALMYGPEYLKEMAELKRVLDPQGLLGTGNLFAGGGNGT